MQEDDNEFFILVAGVLAAIILVICWWFTTGGTATPVQQVASDETASDTHDVDDIDVDDIDANDSHSDDDDEETDLAQLPPVAEPEPTVAAEPEEAPLAPTVFDAIANDGDLSVVADLLRAQGLDAALAGDGPFTVFAPSNDAVNQAAGSDTTVTLLENNATSVLTYHVVPGQYSFDELVEVARTSRSSQLETLAGESLSLSLDGENLIVNGATMITGEPQAAENGVVHTIDNVLVPAVAALNTIVGLQPILFASGSAEIAPESFATLDQLIEILSNSDANVSIEGHTDSSGDPVLNQNLSQSRARSVLNYLVANNVDDSQLSAIGFGSTDPVADNDTEEGRALNRRIEFELQN